MGIHIYIFFIFAVSDNMQKSDEDKTEQNIWDNSNLIDNHIVSILLYKKEQMEQTFLAQYDEPL